MVFIPVNGWAIKLLISFNVKSKLLQHEAFNRVPSLGLGISTLLSNIQVFPHQIPVIRGSALQLSPRQFTPSRVSTKREREINTNESPYDCSKALFLQTELVKLWHPMLFTAKVQRNSPLKSEVGPSSLPFFLESYQGSSYLRCSCLLSTLSSGIGVGKGALLYHQMCWVSPFKLLPYGLTSLTDMAW